jgi:HEAT repeat protein
MENRPTEIQALVARLNNLHEIFRVQTEILSCGEATVEPLAQLLLSAPSGFPEPRVAAAECLGAIGGDKAVDALIRVLDYYDLEILGPVQRFAEETVRNVAARRLAQFDCSKVRDALLLALQRNHLIGAGQALAHLGDARSIPYLIDCLEDDYKKEKATTALRRFGGAAVAYLCKAVERPRFVEGVEPPLSQERRSRAAELLGYLKAEEAVPILESRLHDDSRVVRIACSLALTELGQATEEVLAQMVSGLDDSDSAVRMDCEEGLQKAGAKAVPLVAAIAAGQAIHLPGEEEFNLTQIGRLAAIKILGLTRSPEAVLCLIKLLKDADEIVRYRAVAALGNFTGAEAREILERVAREDPSKRVRMRAKEALQILSRETVLTRH